MLMFTLAVSWLITSNLPWFMDLTFQVPVQSCSLQHQTLLPSPVTFTTGCCFHFGSISSFFLELFLHSSSVGWAPMNLGSSSFSVISFHLFIRFMGFSRQEYWSGLPLVIYWIIVYHASLPPCDRVLHSSSCSVWFAPTQYTGLIPDFELDCVTCSGQWRWVCVELSRDQIWSQPHETWTK